MDRLVERGALFGASEARVAGPDRPGAEADIAEADGRAVGVGLRALAADLVQAPALPVAEIAELQREASGVEMRPALAILVDKAAIGEFRPVLLVEIGRLLEREKVQNGGNEIIRIGRTARDVDDELSRHDVLRGLRAGRIGVGRLDSAPRRARTDRDDRRRTFGGFANVLHLRPAADLAVDAVVLGRRAALGHEDVLALVLLHDLLLVRFRLVARAHAQRLVIFERDEIEDQGFERRMFGAQQRLGAAGAFLSVQPNHGRTRLR